MLDVTSSRKIVGAVLSVLVGAGMAVPANAGIKDEYQRAQECDYSKAEYGSDVGVFDEVKVRFCSYAHEEKTSKKYLNMNLRMDDLLLNQKFVRFLRPSILIKFESELLT